MRQIQCGLNASGMRGWPRPLQTGLYVDQFTAHPALMGINDLGTKLFYESQHVAHASLA